MGALRTRRFAAACAGIKSYPLLRLIATSPDASSVTRPPIPDPVAVVIDVRPGAIGAARALTKM
ncbi:hypothetical protein GCM10008170_21460 [Methylopila capsulata]|uniref:Uncharacterized protein n=1 Tax=Methylopila capsulata TaxID=61654 RepID=A0A9W6MSC8_9HYPH|nr:hypothetical protein GCM10008170_21460 [Methylopila capsulata]